ncbi:MAG: SulP family inorganic anion transporter [Bacteriovoracaceae bacterium]
MSSFWKEDFKSSIVVFLVALPLCLGIALASNAPLSSGLFAGVIGGIVVGFFSNSQISVSGPAAGLTVIVASSITALGSFEAFCFAVMLAGILQILFGVFRGGVIGDFFPTSVIKGMLAAIGIILILKQFPHAVGLDLEYMGSVSYSGPGGSNTFDLLIQGLRGVHPGALLISSLSIVLMIFWEKKAGQGRKIFNLIPGALIAVLISVLLNYLFSIYFPDLSLKEEHLVNIPFSSGLDNFLKNIKLVSFSYWDNWSVYSVAFTIALVASIESLLSVDAADKLDKHSRITSKNKELIAQGIGNSLSGLIGALPVTAVIVRTSANIAGGARTKLSCILHGVWLALCLILVPEMLSKIPLAALAAVLILVGYKLTKPQLIKSMYQAGIDQFFPFVFTIVAILFTDLLVGIFIGMLVGFFFVIKSNLHNSIVVVEEDSTFLIKFYKDSSFLQKPKLQKIFSKIPDGSTVILDGTNSVFIDNDIVDSINTFMRRAREKKINVELKKSSLALCSLFLEEKNGKD